MHGMDALITPDMRRQPSSPLAETGSARLLAVVGLRGDLLDLERHGGSTREKIGGGGRRGRGERATYILESRMSFYRLGIAYDARYARLVLDNPVTYASRHNRPSLVTT